MFSPLSWQWAVEIVGQTAGQKFAEGRKQSPSRNKSAVIRFRQVALAVSVTPSARCIEDQFRHVDFCEVLHIQPHAAVELSLLLEQMQGS